MKSTYLWHEAQASRGPQEVASWLIHLGIDLMSLCIVTSVVVKTKISKLLL